MAFARSVMPKPVRLGTFTQYWEPGAQPDKVRQLYQANVESQTPWIVPSSDEVPVLRDRPECRVKKCEECEI
ncbi:hypothetical protein COCSUDRAFT_63360 [Coccomyxa subellipsoidea C-169]|uniref:Uncharacterized protein n=1 Tax=Coccomyxa subellipsoidea (strain C-169) TaxID=574566 RepID=I0YX48_COCSC|nr:hypothetical protein COCSUDRAFT_63360 [Coccomyxa subellipsoidea C-169]EIE22967.1 hypothetical protein COCSUDRAFT_63360 [Coccomyxa subellipsoidea C-169]|eukprot:XP_005647511.1 hypothetical protein COCSUDRAFT_63360 [Coccomyxa subellipsoidea C-169]